MNKIYRKNVFLVLLFVVIAQLTLMNCCYGFKLPPQDYKVKNLIIIIGDGMGSQQIRLSSIVAGGGDPSFRLDIEKLDITGYAFNHCADKIVTDSAASATAIATGYKTNYGVISMTPDGKILKTILETCRDAGKSTGLITTVNITDATFAAFASHVKSRKMQDDIAGQYVDEGIDVLLGGGSNEFLPESNTGENIKDFKNMKGKRVDGKNLIDGFVSKGYKFVCDRDSLLKTDYNKTNKLLGLFSKEYMAYEIERDKNIEPHISEMTDSAIKILSKNLKGFFLMVEGGKIDWGCHNHDIAAAVYDTIALNEALKVALNYAIKNPSTLIIVLNDHETGGTSITENINPKIISEQKCTAVKIAEMIKNNPSDITNIFRDYAGITDITEGEKQLVTDDINGVLKLEKVLNNGGGMVANIIAKRAGVGFSTQGHTGGPIVVTAKGPGSEYFTGYFDQTEIPQKALKLMRL